jgi:Protein of unknown function (DUF3617)
MKSGHGRRAARAAIVGAALGCSALYAQAVNIKPGMYEIVSTSQVTLSPQLQARLPPGYLEKLQKPHKQQLCITDRDLAKLSKQLAEERGGGDPSCKLLEHSVAGDTVKFLMKCQRATTHFEGTFSSGTFKALLTSQTDHGPMTVKMTGRRSGDCPK